MVPWWLLIPAVMAGAVFGVIVAAVMAASDEEERR